MDDLHPIPTGLHADRFVGLGVRNHKVVLAGAGVVAEDGEDILKGVPLLQTLAQQERHRDSLPVAESTPTHFADGHMLGIHPGHRPHEPGVRDIHERDAPLRFDDDDDRMLLQPPIDGIVEDATVIQRPILRRRT